jgi:hypothetical protein
MEEQEFKNACIQKYEDMQRERDRGCVSKREADLVRKARNEAFAEAAGLAKASSLTWGGSRDVCRGSAVRALDALERVLRTCIEPDRIVEKGE